MSNKIQLKLKRATKVNLPTLEVGEPAFTTDTNDLYIGNGSTNIQFVKKSDLTTINTQVTDINTQVTDIKDQVIDIKDQVTDINTQATDIKDQLDSIPINGGTF